MASIAHQPPLKERDGRRRSGRPRGARMRTGSRKSAAQLRAMVTPDRNRVRAELRAMQLVARTA